MKWFTANNNELVHVTYYYKVREKTKFFKTFKWFIVPIQTYSEGWKKNVKIKT